MNTLWRFSATLLTFLSLFKASRSHSGTPVLTADEIAKVNNLVSSLPKYHIKLTHIKVHTYFHVITDGAIGKVHDMQLQTQMRVLNERFSSIGISFKLIDVTYTNNADWYYNCWQGGNELKASFEMKAALRRGGKAALNVYFVDLKDGPTGYSFFPWDISTKGLMKDGIVMNNRAIPGGTRTNYNMGVQLVHEVGHWLGLYHVFPQVRGVCAPDIDKVPDTPATAYPASEGDGDHLCPLHRDSCPGLPGKDVSSYFFKSLSRMVCREMFSYICLCILFHTSPLQTTWITVLIGVW